MSQVMVDMLARRRDRAIAIMLNMKERECDQHLPKDVSQRLRKVILDQTNDLADFISDVMRSYEDGGGVVVNELYLKKLDEIHMRVVGGNAPE